MKLTRIIPSVALGAALTLGGATGAFAAEASTGAPVDAASRCDKVDEVQARIDQHQERLAELLERLEAKRTEAETAGKDHLVERLDRVIARVEARQERVSVREQRLVEWVEANCGTL